MEGWAEGRSGLIGKCLGYLQIRISDSWLFYNHHQKHGSEYTVEFCVCVWQGN